MKDSKNPYERDNKYGYPTRYLDILHGILNRDNSHDAIIRVLSQQEKDISQLKAALNHAIDAILSLVDEASPDKVSTKLADLVDQLKQFKTK